MGRRKGIWQVYVAALGVLVVSAGVLAAYLESDRESGGEVEHTKRVAPIKIIRPRGRHVPELASYLDRLAVRTPLVYRHLAVFPVVMRDGEYLRGRWLTMDAAIKRGMLIVTEKGGGGTVPVIYVENRSRKHHVFIMAGEVVSGGKQTRTIRQDVVLAPRQKVDIGVYCVQAGRWSGDADFAAGEVAVPQSIKKELRKGTSQGKVWAEVSRSNQSLGFSDSTDSMELSLKSKPVARKLREVRRRIVPEVPTGSVGFIFAYRGRAVGGEFFGTSDLALALLPKLVDSYAADLVLQHKGKRVPHTAVDIDVARGFLRRIRRAGSRHTKTLGSGAGIQTRAAGLVGDGVSIRRATVHYGCQVEERIVPAVKPTPRNRQRGSGFLE